MKIDSKRILAFAVAIAAAALTGCPPIDDTGELGESGRVRFGPTSWPTFAAFGARHEITAQAENDPPEGALVLGSSDPRVLTIATDGTALVTGEPGIASVIASTELDGEVDRISVDVRRPTRVDLGRGGTIFAGHQSLRLVSRWDEETYLGGCGGVTATGGGAVTVRPATAEDATAAWDPAGVEACGNTFVVSGEARGSGEVTLETGDLVSTHAFRIVGLEDIDAIEESARYRFEDDPIMIWVRATSAGEAIVGAPACAWTVSGATIEYEFTNDEESAVSIAPASGPVTATCTIGSVSRTFEL